MKAKNKDEKQIVTLAQDLKESVARVDSVLADIARSMRCAIRDQHGGTASNNLDIAMLRQHFKFHVGGMPRSKKRINFWIYRGYIDTEKGKIVPPRFPDRVASAYLECDDRHRMQLTAALNHVHKIYTAYKKAVAKTEEPERKMSEIAVATGRYGATFEETWGFHFDTTKAREKSPTEDPNLNGWIKIDARL